MGNFSDKISKLLCVIVIGAAIFLVLTAIEGYLLYKTNLQESSEMMLVIISLAASNFIMGCIAYRLFNNLSGSITSCITFLAVLLVFAHCWSNSKSISIMNIWAIMISFIACILGSLLLKNIRGKTAKEE